MFLSTILLAWPHHFTKRVELGSYILFSPTIVVLNDMYQARKVGGFVLECYGVWVLPLSTMFLLGLGIVQTAWYFFLHFITVSLKYAITLLFYFLSCTLIKLVIFVQWQICRRMKWEILIFLHCRSLCRIVIRPLHLDYVKRGMILNTQQQMVKGLHIMGVESLSYTDTKDIHIG